MATDPAVTSPAAPVVAALEAAGQRLAIAESCTGGLVASMVTDVPGASAVLDRAIVAYTPAAKRVELDVDDQVLREAGSVSAPVAQQMAIHVRERAGTSWGLSTTGILGPSGGTERTPVGTVFIAVAEPDGSRVDRLMLEGDRWAMKRQAAKRALAQLLDASRER